VAVAGAEPASSPIPASAVNEKKELWRAAMNAYFGKYDKNARCWISKDTEGEYCLRPHTLHRLWRSQKTRYYLTVAGTRQGDGDCHGCSGRMGFLILQDSGGANLDLLAVSKSPFAVGGWGQAPFEESVFLQRLGTGSNFAWVIEGGFTGQGTTYGWSDIFGVIGNKVENLGQIPQSFDDGGNCDNGVNVTTSIKCSSYEFEINFSATEEPTRFSPILLTGTGNRQGQPFSTRVRIPFDDSKGAYQVPRDKLPPEFQN
jgi:hypothetical protein